jgi:hypothetical protein
MSTPRLHLGGPNDGFARIDQGFCSLYPCPGRLMLCAMETRKVECPQWIEIEAAKLGRPPSKELIEVTTYTYKCIHCGHEVMSTKFIEDALKN